MFSAIGSHYPLLVVVAMVVFGAALLGVSVQDSFRRRH